MYVRLCVYDVSLCVLKCLYAYMQNLFQAFGFLGNAHIAMPLIEEPSIGFIDGKEPAGINLVTLEKK